MRKFLSFLIAMTFSMAIVAQENLWTPKSESDIGKNIFADRPRPSDFKLFQLNESAFSAQISTIPSEKIVRPSASGFILLVPNAEGQMERFRIVEAPVMDPALAARYPGIYSFAGKGIDDPTATIRFAFSKLGFNGTILSSKRPSIYIERVDASTRSYIVVGRDNAVQLPFECSTKDAEKAVNKFDEPTPNKNADDGKLRTYRLALACTGEYAQSWLTTETTDAQRRATVLAAMNNHMTRVNGIMERDFCLRMNLIANNDLLIYLNPATDPWIAEFNAMTQTTIDGAIGDANYDIGHLVKMGGDNGNAGSVGNVCITGAKGSAFTSRSDWTSGIYFEEYILTHEMGHQYDANHTFAHADDNDNAQMEPGSGNTIMSYAGITGAATDIQPLMDDYFHAISIQQATDWIKSHACNGTGVTGLTGPSANAGSDYTIPISTPFKLTGSGSDPDGGDVLTFTWEQMDKLTAPGDFPWLPNTTHTRGPEFKSILPSGSTSRTCPTLESILDGTNTNKWEKLPSVARTLNFRFTVRDNHPGAGQNNSDDMVVTINGAAGPFGITAPNSGVTWCPGTHTVTWSVNGSAALAANVNILLSMDGGSSFPISLAANTANDGTEDVTIPCTYSKAARIKVEAVGNIFFDISNVDFTVGDNTKPTFTAPANITLYKDANCNYNASTTITGDVTDEADNCDNSLNATSSDGTAPGSCVGETVITRTWTLTDDCGNSTVKVQTITIRDNTPPTFTDPPDITIFKDANCNYNASVGVTGDVTDEADNCDPTLNATFTDVVVPGSCIGEEIITRTWSLTDDCGNTTTHVQVITAKDNTPPAIIGANANPSTLWPPNHKMRNVTINYAVHDNCSPVNKIINTLSVVSNEPINGTGDGDTAPDWIVVDNHHVQLRAERAGGGNGRIYTITITSTDDCGNTSTQNVTVTVAHDQSFMVSGETIEPGIKEGMVVRATPNPSSGSFVINVSSNNNKDRITLQVIDIAGRTIEERKMNNDATISIGDRYRPGVYLVRIVQGEMRKEIKLVKQ